MIFQVGACNLCFSPLDLKVCFFFKSQFFRSAGDVIQQIKKVWPYGGIARLSNTWQQVIFFVKQYYPIIWLIWQVS